MSIKHGLLMSLILGITATLGAVGIGPAAADGASPPTLQLASATTAAAPSAARDAAIEPQGILADSEALAQELGAPEAAPAPVQVAANTPAPLAAKNRVPVVNVTPVGLSVPGQDSPAAVLKGISAQVATCAELYLNFTATPRTGAAPLDVTLTCDTSIAVNGGPGTFAAPIEGIQWFVNGTLVKTTVVSPPGDFANNTYTHTFDQDGLYSIGMRVILQDNNGGPLVCPVESEAPFTKQGLIVVGEEDSTAANMEVTDLLCTIDGGSILPLADWIPLLAIKMDYNPEQPAPRVMAYLNYSISSIGGGPVGNGLNEDDIVQYGMFANTGGDGGVADDILDLGVDGHISYDVAPGVGGNRFFPRIVPGTPMLEWQSNGFPYEMPDTNGATDFFDLDYNLNFVFDVNSTSYNPAAPFNLLGPQRPFIKQTRDLEAQNNGPRLNWPIAWNSDIGWGYIIAFKPAASFPTGVTTFRVRVGISEPDGLPASFMLPYSGDRRQFFGDSVDAALPLRASDEPLSNPGVDVAPIPFNQSGPVDSYSPNFFENDSLAEECSVSSSFDVWDVTGGLIWESKTYVPTPVPGVWNNSVLRSQWNWPNKLYTPVAEHTRPRWDLGDTLIEFVTGEWMDIRRVFSVEEWYPVIGINAHGTANQDCNVRLRLRDINVILTDVGADPFGPPGNGGFDPRTQLEHMTTESHGSLGPTVGDMSADGLDYTFNGVGVFSDTGTGDPCGLPDANCGGNGVFDPPTPFDPSGAGAGVGFTDIPLAPKPLGGIDFQNQGYYEWEYIPFPPGGGDPWWRMRLRFTTGHRTEYTDDDGNTIMTTIDTNEDGDYGARGFIACDGQLELTPETDPDLFVVIRPDSGFGDVSGLPGDGTGMPFGTDMRAFVEPRSWNPLDGGHWEGGMTFNVASIEPDVRKISQVEEQKYWQDNANSDVVSVTCSGYDGCTVNSFGAPQAWLNERTQNQNNVKPIRCGIDVHDYTVTYSSNNRYARQSHITVGQHMYYEFPLIGGSTGDIFEVPQLPVNLGLITPDTAVTLSQTAFSLWMDPPTNRTSDEIFDTTGRIGILQALGFSATGFAHIDSPGVSADLSNSSSFSPVDDTLTEIQYAYETVPFALDDDVGFTNENVPVSKFYTNPAPQPNLPDYLNWSPLQREVAGGPNSFCYLLSEGDDANQPFRNPNTSGSEATYADDEYVFVCSEVERGNITDVQPGMWLLDRLGGRYRILEVNGDELTLQRGHSAYLDRFFQFPTRAGATEVNLPDWPYGVKIGPDFAIARGAWSIVPDTLVRNQYPRQSDWPEGLSSNPSPGEPARAARLLKQHVMQESQPTAVLGFNLAGVADPRVNASGEVTLRSLTVAFWGPEFKPSHLNKLDENGELVASGVLLYEDTNGEASGIRGSGVFDGPIFSDLSATPAFRDQIVPLQGGSLQWSASAEPVDLDGDYKGDDLSGDGLAIYTNADLNNYTAEERANWDGLYDSAWVLRIQPAGWVLPHTDFNSTLLGIANDKSAELTPELPQLALDFTKPDYWVKDPKIVDFGPLFDLKAAGRKSLGSAGNFGDDLFVVIRTSDEVKSFENFRVVVPARLPNRTSDADKLAGIQLSPRNYVGVSSFEKQSPDEGPVQDFYGHDMLEVSVPTRVTDMTGTLPPNPLAPAVSRLITPGGPPFAALGIDASQNRPENVIAAGDTATLQNNAFTTGAFTTTPVAPYYVGGDWTAEAAGLWLIAFSAAEKVQDSRIEAYEITAASGKNLTLRAGTPAVDRPWRIVKDPTFLEEVIVELYDRNNDGGFDITQDLLPLNFEDPANNKFSGVSVWRDNDDPDAGGTNGVYDPPLFDEDGNFIRYIDLPVRLDDAPNLIGAAGETSYQVRMVFSSPGTDDSTGRNTKQYEEQPLLRQPIPQTFGRAESDPDYGADFFVVLRTSRNMDGADDVQAAIVSWGPDTPTQPDPDNFTVSLSGSETPGQREDEFDLFDEFPHAARGLGFISFFKDPQPIRYWSYDRDKRKTVPRTEVDHSQDNNEVKHWVRSRANVARRTPILVALPSPTVDFTADRHRQIVNGDVKFTLETTGDVEQVLWDFGDGTTDTARDPVHKFAAKGFYDIKVTVRDQYGIEDSEIKEDYIEIVDLPLADFTGTPTDATLLYEEAKNPPIGRDVAFVDLSLGDDNFIPVRWAWNFGDGTNQVTTTKATAEAPLIHRYTQTGFYTVTLETTFTDNATGATVRKIAQIRDYITIRPCVGCPGAEGEGEGEGQTDVPAADFSIATEIRDKEALVPLSDWVPLVNFTMSYGEDDPAPRNLQYLRLLLRPDGRKPEDLGYQNIAGPQSTDLLEFGLFFETKNDDDAKNQELNIENDFLLYKWNADGGPVGTIEDEGFGFVRYFLDFIGNGTPAEPQFPVPAGPDSDGNVAGYSYIIAVRTSATWRSQITMRCDVELARMITPGSGSFPVDDEGAPIDSYSPNFYDNETLEDEAAYSSSFDVWSITGTAGGVPGQDQSEGFGVGEYDAWSNGRVLYTPLAEHSRPRWNAPGHLVSAVGGEFLELRSLVGLEQWLPVVGINAHSTAPVHIFDGTNGPRTYVENLSQLSEVNLVVTDVGGDPFGPPGNGGFNPIDMLHRESLDAVGTNDYAIGSDVSFSGAWVWHDTNGNSLFDVPTPNAETGGATLNGDRPMSPDYASAWEYVPLPPGGGDPWWKIKLGFFGGTRRIFTGEQDEEGYLEKVPDRINPFAGDSFVGSSEYTLDYFVVLRPDSGTQDASTLAGDGSGMAPGADFRAFIEPRRFNAITGNYDGGIYLDSMAAPQGLSFEDGEIIDPWQNDARWGTYEPWWPQRTVNANATQKVQSGVEVHDLVMTYETDSPYGVVSNLFFGQGSYTEEHSCLGYSIPGEELTDFDQWLDPLGLLSAQFLNRHTVGVTRVGLELTANFPLSFGDVVNDTLTFALVEDGSQFAFETAPFNNGYDGILTPRSAAYPLPPSQPTLPEYATWSFDLKPGEYPRASQWADANSKARLLTQKTDIESDVTGILGINLAGTADPFVNRGTPPALRSITVAFWGPSFDPSKLAALDANGETPTAGVTLWEDADKSGFQSSGPFAFGLSTGTFIPPTTLQDYLQFQDSIGLLDVFDKPVTLRNLAWGSRSELVDLDGDSVADDMNGDGVVDAADKAWVLTITPRVAWQIPQNDLYSVLLDEFLLACPTLSGDKDNMRPGGSYVLEHNNDDQKQIDVTGRGAGDDLFIAVRTSDRMSRFEKFRAVVPATLPERAEGQRVGGIQFTTGPAMSLQAAIKSNPEEDPEQDFYGHDMLEVNVPTRILDQTSQSQTIVIGGAATPSLALDLATNLDLTVDSGTDGSGADKTFTVSGKAWTPNAFATAHWLIDSRYEAYQIVANTANQLQLLSGTPRGGKWRIVKDPTFFEQLIVEFYNEGTDAEFNPALDLLPLNLDQQLSGVAIYRDNDNDPSNRNGLFDPGVDIPLTLDAAPAFVGASGSDMQVKFVFSSPGTDDYAGATRDTSGNLIAGGGVSIAEQARNRQWVPDTFGNTTSDPNSGADFFVVVRAAPTMTPNDNFRMGIVNWGPNTPTEPDPDTWAALAGNERNDFSKFEEFPWGQRGIGFISFFGTPPGRYYLDGAKAGYKEDNSGYNWVRSHSTKKRRTGAIKAITRPLNANSLVIDSASQTTLPPQILPDENFQVVIRGRGFGTKPDVHLSGYTVEVLGASDTAIDLRLRTTPEVVPQEPIVLIISNLAKNETQSRSDLFTLEQVSTDGPRITAVVPSRAKASDFPVTIVGENFPSLEKVRVYFGLALMNAVSVSPDGKSILVQLPVGGLPGDGLRNVTVQELKSNQTLAAQDILVDGFYYDNPVVKPDKGFFLCAPGGPAGDSSRGDWLLISTTLLALAALTLRRRAAR